MVSNFFFSCEPCRSRIQNKFLHLFESPGIDLQFWLYELILFVTVEIQPRAAKKIVGEPQGEAGELQRVGRTAQEAL